MTNTVIFKYRCPECGRRYNLYMPEELAKKADTKYYKKSTVCEDCVTKIFRRKNK